MNFFTKAVHSGDRRKPGAHIPVTTPITNAATYIYESVAELDAMFEKPEMGYAYARWDNPTNSALEELITSLEGGAGTLACASGMAALNTAIQTALLDRPKRIVAANALYGATVSLLDKVLAPFGIETTYVDICDLTATEQAIASEKPGCVVMETISNPLLRVGAIDRVAELSRKANAALVVDNTFATPLLVRPLELGAHFSVHSVTKYLAGHGDVIGGSITCDADHYPVLRQLSRIYGPILGPFESYLTMRGIKTFPLRMERQCANASRIAHWLESHPNVQKVNYLESPSHPDAATIARLMPTGLRGAMISVELKGAGRADVIAFMDRLKLVVRATSLGDVHSMVLYPVMASHRDVPPKQRERLGIRDSLVRLSVGIEDPADVIADLDHALTSGN